MIFYDVTRSAAAGHRSGLMRVNSRLREEMGGAISPVEWGNWDRATGRDDWFLSTELFSEAERPGLREFLHRRKCRCAALYFDAIPLKHPTITWPQSVARHPDYLKLLASFDRIWAISAASREELLGFWSWAGVDRPPPVETLALGADFLPKPVGGTGLVVGQAAGLACRGEAMTASSARLRSLIRELRRGSLPSLPRWRRLAPGQRPGLQERPAEIEPALVCVGILEPRKNQSFLLAVCEELWAEQLRFELHLVGRPNPLFSRRLMRQIKSLRGRGFGVYHHSAAGDAEVAALYARARASVLPTLAEGCGLPLLESLWMGVPCVCSDLPVLLENTVGGGCLPVALNEAAAWKSVLRQILTDDTLHRRLTAEAASRALPTWSETARTILSGLASASRS